jgi:hypothetical protein
MQSHYAEHFDREMGCTVAEWLGWLPAALGEAAYELQGNRVNAKILAGSTVGSLAIIWRQGEPRRIALFSLPILHVSFQFEGLDDAQRYTFMKRFDLYMQRGGG